MKMMSSSSSLDLSRDKNAGVNTRLDTLDGDLETSKVSSRSAVSSVLAGYIAGSASLVIGHPLDSLKVLKQTGTYRSYGTGCTSAASIINPTNNSPSSSTVPTKLKSAAGPRGGGPIAIQIRTKNTVSLPAHTQTIRNLYAGISIPLFSIGAIQALNFVFFDTARRALYTNFSFARSESNDSAISNFPSQSDDYRNKDTLASVTIASFVAGGFVSLFSSPILVIKTKQQVMLWNAKTAIRETLRNAGSWRGFYMGMGSHVFCDSVGRACYYPTYEMLKRHIVSSKSMEGSVPYELGLVERMFCAGIGGMTCWAVIFPFDAVRSRIYARSGPSFSNNSSLQMAKKMYEEGGVRIFFRGYGWTVLRIFPVAAIMLPAYDLSLELLS